MVLYIAVWEQKDEIYNNVIMYKDWENTAENIN
jgi:hypothetical protein